MRRFLPLCVLSLLGAWITVQTRGQYCLPIFTGAGADAWGGLDPYILKEGRPDFFKYSPAWAILLSPLLLLPSVIAPGCWYLLNAGAFWRAVWIFKRELTKGDQPFDWLELLLLLPFMLTNGFYGQINSILLLIIIESYRLLRFSSPSKQFTAGLLLAAAAWMKLFPAYLALLWGTQSPVRRLLSSGALGILGGIALGGVLPLAFWRDDTLRVFYSWVEVIHRDLENPHHKLGLLALLIQTGVTLSVATWIQKISASVFFLGLVFLGGRHSAWQPHRMLALALTGFLFFSHMTEPPTLALLAPAILYLRINGKILDWVILLLFLVLLPSDLTPSVIKQALGGQYAIKTLGMGYCLFSLIRSPGFTNSPG